MYDKGRLCNKVMINFMTDFKTTQLVGFCIPKIVCKLHLLSMNLIVWVSHVFNVQDLID